MFAPCQPGTGPHNAGVNKPLPAFLALLLLYGVVTFGALGTRDLWAPDEPRFAQIGREMLRSGDAVMPRMNGDPVALLPPLYYWVTAAAGIPAGDVTPAAARAGSALGGLLMLAAVFVLANAWRGPRAAFLSGLVLITSVKFWHQSIWSQVDLLVSGFITWAISAFWLAHERFVRSRDGTGDPGGRPYIWPLAGFVFMALGTLTKGPLAVAAPGCVFFILILVEKRWGFLRPGWILSGILLYAAITVPWYWLACRAGGDAFTQEMVFKHNLGMFFDTWSHKQPFYYYHLNLPWMFFPWILFLPAACRGGVTPPLPLDTGTPPSDSAPEPVGAGLPRPYDRDHRRFLWIWFLSLFVFFSLSEAKQHKYLLPAFPPLAILVGVWLASPAAAASRTRKAAPWILAGLVFAMTGAAAAVFLTPPETIRSLGERFHAKPETLDDVMQALPAFRTPAGLLIAALLATWGICPFLARRAGLPSAVAAGVVAVFLVAAHAVFPVVDEFKSARPLCERTTKRLRPDDVIGIYGIQFRQIGYYVYYTDRRLRTFEDAKEQPDAAQLEEFWSKAGTERRYCFIQDEDYDKLPAGLRKRMRRLDEESVGHRIMYLVANREP